MTSLFRRRALAAGALAGAVALAGLIVMRHSGLDLTRGLALAMVGVSAAAGLVTMALCGRSRFGLARLSAALAVVAVVAGWAAAQAPRMLPGMTVGQAAAGRSTLIALTIAVAGGAVVLVPSLILLYTLFLRGRLDAPDTTHSLDTMRSAAPPPAAAPAQAAPPSPLPRASVAVAIAGLVAGTALLVFTDPVWAHGLGVACLIACAVATFRLATKPDGG
jgi:cytochrome d ubiquinol oxidase subunit II